MNDTIRLQRHQELRKLEEDNRRVGAAFIATELDIAITFFQIAGSTQDRDTFERNVGLAKTAFSAATRFMGNTCLTAAERKQIEGQLFHVRELSARVNGHL